MRRRSSFRAVRGGTVIEIQRGILQSGIPITVDGIFGQQSERAVKIWQGKNSLPASGMVDEITWFGITNNPLPSYFRRSLAITAAFEGHGYTRAKGNWDNAYLTWGIIGFTLKHDNFGRVIEMIEDRHPGLLKQEMGEDKAKQLLSVIGASLAKRRSFGNSISVRPKKYDIRPDWGDAFIALGNRAEVRSIQEEVARKVYWAGALKDLRKFGQRTEADAALFFDTRVQNGGINPRKATLIQKGLADNPNATGRKRLSLIAKAIAEGSNRTYRSDVLSRKKALGVGKGTVHGSKYFIEDWMIDLQTVTDDDLENVSN